jgi:hypothetical protein
MVDNINISVGTELHISAQEPATYDKAGFAALSYTEVGEVGDIPQFGGTAQIAEFTPIKSGTVNKAKGTINYGSSNINLATVFSDAGQAMMQSGFDGANRNVVHSVKLVNAKIGTVYFTAMISSWQYNYGDANTVHQAQATLELTNKPVVDADVFTVTYTADAGLYIVGPSVQLVPSGGDAEPVYAAEDTATFSAWDDATATQLRHDTNITADATYNANAV